MNGNVKKAVLRVLLLKEEFSKKELSEAVKFISNNLEADLFDYLADNKQNIEKKRSPTKPITDQISRAVTELKEKDIEKYNLLKNFDLSIRKGELLPRMDSIRQLGIRFSKEFDAGKSRKEGIPRLMNLLSKVSITELKSTIIETVEETGRESSEYAELANFLIHGDSKKST